VLVRDVAYAQIPRTSRARRHRAAARWIQDLAGDRVADRAELIAYHFTQALAHARAAMEPDLAELEGSTREALVLAGDSMLGLNLARAEAHYRQALELCPPDAPGRARVAARVGRAAFQAGRVAEAASTYEGPRRARGGARRPRRPGGMEDLRAALAVGLEIGAGYDTAVVYNNLIEPLWLSEGPAAALATCQEAIEFSERRGLVEGAAWVRSATLVPLLDLGRWDEAVATADAVVGWEQEQGGQYMSQMAHQVKARVLLWRGQLEAARALTREFLPRARSIDDLQLLVPALATAAAVEQAARAPTAASALVEEVLGVVGDRDGGGWYLGQQVTDLVRVCVAVGRRAAAAALAAQANDGVARNRHGLLAARATLAEADGALEEAARRYDEAAARWAEFGHQLERARACSAPAGASWPSAGRRAGPGSRPPAACWRRSTPDRSWPRPTRRCGPMTADPMFLGEVSIWAGPVRS